MAREPVIEYFDMRAEIIAGERLEIKDTSTGDNVLLDLQEMRGLQAFLNECLGSTPETRADAVARWNCKSYCRCETREGHFERNDETGVWVRYEDIAAPGFKVTGSPVVRCVWRDGCRRHPTCMHEGRCCEPLQVKTGGDV